jgi:hypothetical protein
MPQLRLAPDLGPIGRFAYQRCLNFESWGINHCSGRSQTASRLVPQLTSSRGQVEIEVGAEVEVKFLILKHPINLDELHRGSAPAFDRPMSDRCLTVPALPCLPLGLEWMIEVVVHGDRTG